MAVKEKPAYVARDKKEQVGNRLRRIEGQVRGIERMVDEERYCIEVLTQIAAARAALDRVALELLEDHARECVVGAKQAQRDERTEEMIGAVARLVGTG